MCKTDIRATLVSWSWEATVLYRCKIPRWIWFRCFPGPTVNLWPLKHRKQWLMIEWCNRVLSIVCFCIILHTGQKCPKSAFFYLTVNGLQGWTTVRPWQILSLDAFVGRFFGTFFYLRENGHLKAEQFEKYLSKKNRCEKSRKRTDIPPFVIESPWEIQAKSCILPTFTCFGTIPGIFEKKPFPWSWIVYISIVHPKKLNHSSFSVPAHVCAAEIMFMCGSYLLNEDRI